MSRTWNWLGPLGLVLAMVWAMSMDNPKAPSRVTQESDVQPIQREQLKVAPRAPAATAPVAVTESAKPEKQWPARPFQYQPDLDLFAKIRSKVFLNDQEKAERERLLHDASLLRALGMRLTEASLAPSVTSSQDAAVQLLIEALKSGDKALASEVARAVIEDSAVENSTTDRSVRENLAGIKAEVLYHWAAIMPDEASNIARSLPGPVSRKIWDNVNSRHASNAAESQQELAKRK